MLYSEVPAHNAMWRDISGVTLRSLFAKGMCDAAICDIRATGCVPRSLAALRHVKGFSAAAIANVLLTVRCTAASSFLSCSRVLPPPPPSVASYVSAIGSLLSLFLSFSRSLVLSFSRSLFFLFPSPLNADYKSVIRHDANMHMHMRMYNKGHLLCLRICKTVALASRRLPNVASDVIDNSPKPLRCSLTRETLKVVPSTPLRRRGRRTPSVSSRGSKARYLCHSMLTCDFTFR